MPAKLKTRATPKQARAQARVDVILEAAIRLLETRPPSDLTAMQVAAEAAVPVSSIYRYFPTIDDLIAELYLQAADELRQGLLASAAMPGTWRARLRGALDLMRHFLRAHPYYRAVLLLIAVRRGPQGLEHDFNQEIATFFEQRWAQGRDGFCGGDPRVVAATLVQMVLSLEELLIQQSDPQDEAAHFREMTRAAECYLSLYLNDAEGESP